jgi:energy-coupling factor transport system permease protein
VTTQTLQRLNPSMKLLAVALTAIALTFILDPVTPAVLFVLTLAVGRFLGGLPVWRQVKPLLVFVIVGVAILVANIFFNKHNAEADALVWIGAVKVTRPALWAAGSLWMRLMCFALLSLVFVRTTPPQDLILSLVHQLRLNYRVAYGTMVGYRMLPLFRSDYEAIQAAQRVRGVQDGRGIVHSVRRLRRYAIPLLAGSVRKAGRVAIAMDARAFGAFPERTYRVRMVVRRRDRLFLLAVIVVVAGVIVGLRLAGIARFTWGAAS